MRIADLVETSRLVGATRARGEKIALLAQCLRRLAEQSPAGVAVGVAWLAGDLPQGRIGLGHSALMAERSRPAATEATLLLDEVDQAFAAIKRERGAGAARRRLAILASLLERATPAEQDFVLRLVIGEMRQGALEGVMTDAVARAFDVPAEAVRKSTMLAGGLPQVAAALAEAGGVGLERFALRLFQPLQAMLAEPAADARDALETLGEAALEYKFDGARVQVHKDGERVEAYTRSLHRITASVPEIVERVAALPVRQAVLDGEVIAMAPDGRPLPFQETMRRFGRRLDIERLRRELPLTAYFFDALRVDADTLVERPLAQRWEALVAATDPGLRVPRIVTSRPEEAETFVARALAAGHEGVMAKALESEYRTGRRGREWLKIKAAHTLDLVVLAAEWGSGRRRGWLSNLHLGARDPRRGVFVMLGKTFKGLTDEVLRWQTEALLARELGREDGTVHVRPELVVEIAFNDVQVSPQYPGGVALRFARVKRYRPDKRAEEADTIDRVRGLLPQGPAVADAETGSI